MPVLRTKTIKTLKDYVSLVEKLQVERKVTFWYRGCGRMGHELKPSLYRHNGSKTIEDLIALEKRLLARFKQKSIPFLSRTMSDSWEWLFLMQHYGVPTRLLDWTESPLMALFFAVTLCPHTLGSRGRPVFQGDASIWFLDPARWNRRAVELRAFAGSILMTDDPYSTAYKPDGDTNMMKSYPIAIYGAHNSQRIVAQRGVFVCFGKDTRPMEEVYERERFPAGCLMKVVIKRGHLPHIYDALRRHGLTDSVAFPDLDGLAREIKREYSFEV